MNEVGDTSKEPMKESRVEHGAQVAQQIGVEQAARERGADVHVPPPLVFVCCALLGSTLQARAASLSLPAELSGFRWVGVAVAAIGLGLGVSAIALFARSRQDPKPWTPATELLSNGPYRFTRNPIYVGFTLLQIGIGLATNVLWIALLAPISLVLVHFAAVLKEEEYLTNKFGDGYRTYRTKVRRYL